MAGIRGIIIHLERATERAAHVAALRETLPIPSEILPAIDARTADLTAYRPDPGLDPRYPFPLHDTEIAIFLSHRAAWQRILDADLPGGLVLEDDVTFDRETFPSALALARDVLTPNRVVRLPFKNREGIGDIVAERDGICAFRPDVVGLNLQATLVGRDAARGLLAASETFDRPVDSWMQMTWEHGVDILTLWPTGVSELSAGLGGSTQGKRRGIGARLVAELARLRYRRAIAARSRRN